MFKRTSKKKTALYNTHVKLNAKLVPFAGYQMPVMYNKINNEYTSRNAKIVKKALDNRAGIVISSGSTTSVLDTAVDNKHSLFAYKFIDILQKNKSFVTSTKVFVELSDYHAGFKQTPQRYFVSNWGHLDGDFVFIPKK